MAAAVVVAAGRWSASPERRNAAEDHGGAMAGDERSGPAFEAGERGEHGHSPWQ